MCAAGLLHSAYSTQFYPQALLAHTERSRLRTIVGRRAESLIHYFCTLDRAALWDEFSNRRFRAREVIRARRLDGTSKRIAASTVRHLLLIESANIAEQSRGADGGPAPWMSQVLGLWRAIGLAPAPGVVSETPVLSAAADHAAIRAYRRALTLPAARAARHFDRAIRANPSAAEPWILRGACTDPKNRSEAIDHAEEGMRRIASWAVSWDQRLTVPGWLAVAARVREQRNDTETYPIVTAVLAGRRRPPTWLDGKR